MIALRCQQLTERAFFQRLVIGVIIIAGLLAGLETNAAAVREAGAFLRWLDKAVLAFFILELALRLTAHGRQPWRFFQDGWNLFDFVIVAFCLLPATGPFAAVLRLARVLRLFRLVSAVPKLQLLTGALLKSLGAMGYVGILLALVAYIYGVLGVHLFGGHDARHFGSLGSALLTLFQIITLDNWSDILTGLRAHAPVAALAYFVSFILLGTMIMLNLFIGIIMNSMSAMHAEMEENERARHLLETGQPTVVDELHRLERQVELLRQQTTLILRRAKAEEDSTRAQPAPGTHPRSMNSDSAPASTSAPAVSSTTTIRPARLFSFSTQLKELAHQVGEQPIRLDELAAVFQGRTSNVFLILLALPFLTPVPLPLLSLPFGIIIALSGVCMALRRKPWLPSRFADKQLPGGTLRRILIVAGRLIGWLERLARPRWIYAEHLRAFRRLNGTLIAIAGGLLLLPLPIPFSNLFPATAVVLLALGGLQRDGLCFLCGCLALLLSLGYLVGLAVGGTEVLSRFWP